MFKTKFRNVILTSAFLGWGCGNSDGDNSSNMGPVTDSSASATDSAAATGPGAPTAAPTSPMQTSTPVPGASTDGNVVPPTGANTNMVPPGTDTGTGTTPPPMNTTPGTTPMGSGGADTMPTGAATDMPPPNAGGGGMGPVPTDEPPVPPADPTPPNLVVTSAEGDFWKVGEWTEASGGTPNVTVNDAMAAQTWEGFGGSFNEIGWNVLTSDEMKAEAIKLLFSATEGANLTWGRIPIGASDYGVTRYSLADTGEDVVPNAGETNRPPVDLELNSFSLARDGELLIPYIKAAQGLKEDIRFWASPWSPPTWMKTGYKTNSGGRNGGDAVRPSYFDGGNMSSDPDILAAYAQYFVKFVEGYKEQGINVEVVSPQNEPGYDQNYPSCLWDSQTYVSFIGQHLGPAMDAIGVRVMLGTMSNAGDNNVNDLAIVDAVMANATAKGFVSLGGAQWGVLGRVNEGASFGGLPVWATEHKCGNYPWDPAGYPPYNMSQAPNDMPYGVESWGYLRDAINKGKVTSYSAWNMVLDKYGLGNDESRHWGQNALLVADGGMVKPTPFYYVFRHLAQYSSPGATVVSAGNDAVAFKNPNGSLVAVIYNSGAANPNYVVSIGGKNVTFPMPAAGWATVKVTP